MNEFRPLDWITDEIAIGTFEGPFPSDAAVIDVRSVKDHCFIPAETFDQVIASIDTALSSGKVVVHCIGGISRSPTFVAVWLATRTGVSLDEAFQLIRAKRPVIQPHGEQFRAAREYLVVWRDRAENPTFDMQVLEAVNELEKETGDAHWWPIDERLTRLGSKFEVGELFTSLNRLESVGFLAGEMKPRTVDRSATGLKRVYSVTPAGSARLKQDGK